MIEKKRIYGSRERKRAGEQRGGGVEKNGGMGKDFFAGLKKMCIFAVLCPHW